MHIEVANNNGTKYLRLARCRRGTNTKGKRTILKEVVLNIGPLSRFSDGKADYLERLRASFAAGAPLIESLMPYVGKASEAVHVIRYRDGDPACDGEPKRLAACVLDPVFSALGLDQLFASVKHASKIRYDLQGLVRLLVYGRILEPASKCATMEQNGKYHEPLVSSDNPDNVYYGLLFVMTRLPNANSRAIRLDLIDVPTLNPDILRLLDGLLNDYGLLNNDGLPNNRRRCHDSRGGLHHNGF